jgi:peptide/nickel transport system substrate-binding protein
MNKVRIPIAAAALLLLLLGLVMPLPARGAREARPLRFALSGNPDTLDPHKTTGTLTFQVLKSVYDTLVEPDQAGKIVPALAESWSVSGDGRSWTFRLRKNVLFHNGDQFTSRDVKATFERLLDRKTASPHVNDFNVISSIETPGDSTVVLRLAAPFAPLLSYLASGWGAILPASLIAQDHNFGARPVGTGPFILADWIRDDKVVLRKNPRYWMQGQPVLDGLEFRIVPERSVQVQGLLNGEIDMVDLNDNVQVPFIERQPSTKVDVSMTSLVMVLAMNTRRPLLNDLRVRQAINLAVDKKQVIDVAYGGGKVIGTFMDFSDPFYKDFSGLYPYNPERARALLAQAGVGPANVLEMALPQNYEPHVKAGQLFQEMLSKVGLTVKLKLVDWATWIGDVYRGGNFDLTVIGHTGKLDPDGRLNGSQIVYTGWKNEEAARLAAAARSTPGFESRKRMYDRILEIYAREVPFVFVGTSYRYIAMQRNIEGFLMQTKLDTFDFRKTAFR